MEMKAIKASVLRSVLAVISFAIFIAIFSSAGLSTTIDSHFRCENENTATTFYSYVKGPQLQDSAYSNGLKTGTFNYFKNGTITLDDKLVYYDGDEDIDHPVNSSDHNSTIKHSLDVQFDSEDGKGISEFYAAGIYNNRAISAWKKIWHDERDNLPSDQITVKADVSMNSSGIYNLKYKAKAHESYFVFKDKTSWSNKTGSRRDDWEQEGLMKGEVIKVTNDLRSENLFKPRGGFGDWLPCCIVTGTIPPIEPIEGEDSKWPSAGVKATLLPQDLKLTNCQEKGNCKNFACILTTGEGALSGTSGAIDWQYLQSLPQVQVESFSEYIDEDLIEITTNVRNLGSVEAQDVVLVNTMPPDAKYVLGSATVDDSTQHPQKLDENILAWDLGNLQAVSGPEGESSIVFELNATEMGPGVESEWNTVYATYRIGSESKNTLPAVNSTETLAPSLWGG